MQGKRANAESGQLHCVQQGDLEHPVCFCATTWPVLVTFYLIKENHHYHCNYSINTQYLVKFVSQHLEHTGNLRHKVYLYNRVLHKTYC